MNLSTVYCTLDPAYYEFGYKEHTVKVNRILRMKIIDCNVIKFGFNEHTPVTNSFFCIFLLVVSETQCKSPVINLLMNVSLNVQIVIPIYITVRTRLLNMSVLFD